MRKVLMLRPGEGRTYAMGRISAVFKADGTETAEQYSISEWWLEPHTKGPGPHAHPEDDVFFVIDGTMSFLVDGNWVDAPKSSFVLVPGGSTHDFENRGSRSRRRSELFCSWQFRGGEAGYSSVVRRASARSCRRLTRSVQLERREA